MDEEKESASVILISKNLAAATPAAAATTTTTATAAAATAAAATSTTTAATAGNWGSEKKQLETQISDPKKQKRDNFIFSKRNFFSGANFPAEKNASLTTVLYFRFQMTRIFLSEQDVVAICRNRAATMAIREEQTNNKQRTK